MSQLRHSLIPAVVKLIRGVQKPKVDESSIFDTLQKLEL